MSLYGRKEQLISPVKRSKVVRKTTARGPRRRSPVDRRSGEDRRQSYNLDIVEKLGMDRRKSGSDRRIQLFEQREGWVRVDRWTSVCIDPRALFY